MPYISRLTQQGRDAIVDAETGLLLKFTRIGLSDQVVLEADIDPMEPADLTVIVDSAIAAVARTAPSQLTITSRLNLLTVPFEFPLWSMGIFATITDTLGVEGPELLYGMVICDTGPEVIRPGSTLSVIAYTFKIATVIGNANNVTAIFSPDFEISNIGLPADGAGFYSRRIGNEFLFKRLAAGDNVNISESLDLVSISGTSPFLLGMMLPFIGNLAPVGWLLCRGQAVSRVTYAPLFSFMLGLGLPFGAGDGVTTFNLPDCSDRTLIGVSATKLLGNIGGAETHILTVNELASHDHFTQDLGHVHTMGDLGHAHTIFDPAHDHGYIFPNLFGAPGIGSSVPNNPPWYNNFFDFTAAAFTNIRINAASSNVFAHSGNANLVTHPSGGNAPHNNMQPWLAINYIIKH